MLEAKYAFDGAGKMGKPFGGKIVQGSPEWLQKSLMHIKMQDVSWNENRFAKIMEDAGDTRFRRVLEAVECVHNHVKNKRSTLKPQQISDLYNFVNPADIRNILKGSMSAKHFDEYAEFWSEHFHFSVLNKLGKKPTYFEDVVTASVRYAQIMGKDMRKVSRKMMFAAIK